VTTPSSELVVADSAGRLIGSAMLGHDGHRGWVYYLAVHPNWQRNGIGRSLMSYAERWMDERQVPKIQAMIRADNLPVRGFYRRLGYQDNDVQVVEKFLNQRSKPSA
jgi:ribosomal protein S18 acetylase RimI-like enzyme